MNKYKAKKVNGRKVDEHRLVMEKHLGRTLTSHEVVHHIDLNKSNNDLDNLILFPTQSAHCKFHIAQGDIILFSGQNKKKLIDGKLKCNIYEELKEISEFVKGPKLYLGVEGRCKSCFNKRRRSRTS